MDFLLPRLDYVSYSLILQTLPLFAILSSPNQRPELPSYVVGFQVALICIFYLAWGGYSTDAWRYLNGFDGTPFSFHREWGFWLLGASFSYLVHDPWAMKLYSTLCAGTAAAGVVWYLKRYSGLCAVIGLFILVSTPVFILAFGNVVRQGMGMAIMLPAIVCLMDGRRRWFVVLTILAMMFHLSAVVLALAALLSTLPKRIALVALVASPVLGLGVPKLLTFAGMNPAAWVPYAFREEGSLHLTKFIVAYPVVWLVLLGSIRTEDGQASMEHTFVYTACFSFLFLNYEVPFERLLLYALILPCVIVPPYILRYFRSRSALAGLWVAGIAGNVLIWTHESTVATLGYAW